MPTQILSEIEVQIEDFSRRTRESKENWYAMRSSRTLRTERMCC